MRFLYLLIIITLLFSCKTQSVTLDARDFSDFTLLDTLYVTSSRIDSNQTIESYQEYRGSYNRKVDLKHTRLHVSFDWENELVYGEAILSLSPVFYRTSEIILDAKNFEIRSIENNNQPLSYEYNKKKLIINLKKDLERDESIDVTIKYIAHPSDRGQHPNMVPKADLGLFFINPQGKEEKPRQIWTQGETENNSRWFPTIDGPNEKMTQEIYITVDNSLKTLSNGNLISSIENTDNTRTDYWKQMTPHAPYLTAIVIGDYAVVTEKYDTLNLSYYVEPEYKSNAKRIFNHTSEMIGFFSEKFQYPFPWEKYAQVVSRDFVSGAMENTGAVIFGEFVQKEERALQDENNDDIVAHELSHHWFGNLVTCESWANLTLNEGFANYSEYLWREHKYGYTSAETHRLNELIYYFYDATFAGTHPLIDFHYEDKEEMFDAHSYNKGGLVLHMLRNYLGDEMFFEGVSMYLNKYKFETVEAHQLRLIFEKISGEDLNWYFDQWYFDKGHPELDVHYDWTKNDSIYITVYQTQNETDHRAVFTLPLTSYIYHGSGEITTWNYTLTKRKNKISIPKRGDEKTIVIDGKHTLLAKISEKKTLAEWEHLVLFSKEYRDHANALENIDSTNSDIVLRFINHPSEEIRKKAILKFSDQLSEQTLIDKSLEDKNPEVRSNALFSLYTKNKNKGASIAKEIYDKKPSFRLTETCLSLLYDFDETNTITLIEEEAINNPKTLMPLISNVFAIQNKSQYLIYFHKNLSNALSLDYLEFITIYKDLSIVGTDEEILTSIRNLEQALSFNKDVFQQDAIKTALKSLVKDCDLRVIGGSFTEKERQYIIKLKSVID